MKLTNEMRKKINAEVRALCGANPLAEVGCRTSTITGTWQPNGLNWEAHNDLGDFTRLSELKEIDDCPGLPGAATLDLYVTSGIRDRELETNVYVTIKDGQVVDVHTQDLQSDARTMAILGRPFSKE